MLKCIQWAGLSVLVAVVAARADERKFDLSDAPVNQAPPGMSSLVAGEGKPGDWRVILDEAPLEQPLFGTNAMRTARKSVVAQMARDTTDEHFPLLVLTTNTYSDFTFTTKFKLADGKEEQMAGVAFRMQDEKNFYVVRASGIGGTFNFYKVDKGQRFPAITRQIAFKTNEWHELSIHTEGNKIQIQLDGQDSLLITDQTFASGKIALWTKSDSVSYFSDMRVNFKSSEPLAQEMVRAMMKENPRLLGLKVFAPGGTNGTKMIASNDLKEIGQPGEASDADVIKRGVGYYERKKEVAIVTMPLRDRNGDPVAAVRVMLRPNIGQTEENARIRALPIIKTMEDRLAAAKSLTD